MFDMVLEASSSPRTRERMDNLICCNTSGLPGGGLFRDKVIEIYVRAVKTKLRNLHTSMRDQVLDKAIASLSTISKIVDHDLQAMCAGNLNLQSSYDFIGDDARGYMKEKVDQLDPFSSTRKKVNLLDKSPGLSPFTGMTKERLDQFAKRSKKNFKRNYPVRLADVSLSADDASVADMGVSSADMGVSSADMVVSIADMGVSSADIRVNSADIRVNSADGWVSTADKESQLTNEGRQLSSERGQLSRYGSQLNRNEGQLTREGGQFGRNEFQFSRNGDQHNSDEGHFRH